MSDWGLLSRFDRFMELSDAGLTSSTDPGVPARDNLLAEHRRTACLNTSWQ